MIARWKLISLSVVAIFASASAVYAYWRINAPPQTLYVTATDPPLELRMELDKTEFQQGEKIVVRLFLKNIGSETVEIIFSQWAAADDPPIKHVLNFNVKDSKGNTVYIRFTAFFQSIVKVTLEPGEQRIETLEWNLPFKPDTYKIIGQTISYSTLGQRLKTLETPAIEITID